MLIHLDTDFGGDPDDACALAFLLAHPSVRLTGITTNLDYSGYRAACVRHYLTSAGVSDIPVQAGAGVTLTDRRRYDSTATDPRYWPIPVTPEVPSPGAALELLAHSLSEGATIVAIGAATNLALLEVLQPGILSSAQVVFMGGWVEEPAPGFPNWGPDADWNVQCDQLAARIVASEATVTLVPLAATVKVWLRALHLPRLRAAGPVGQLLARQSELYARDKDIETLPAQYPGLPSDLLNFHHDPLAAAVALNWPGAHVESARLSLSLRGESLWFEPDDAGRLMNVVTDVDGAAFSEYWLHTIEEQRPAI